MKLKLLKSKKALSYLWRKNGKRNIKEGKESHRWKGGTRKDSYGYVWIYSPEHINASSKYVREHRLVVENKIGRYLFREEVVHHINEIKDDNGIDNLMLFENDREHIKFHTKIRQFGMTNPILRQIENRWKKLKKPIKPNV
ncbi:MAG: HNH endonuclease [Nanoarchaeota archaeon]|nr:HNH endonuclease [Nanoarchaeota archaeon]